MDALCSILAANALAVGLLAAAVAAAAVVVRRPAFENRAWLLVLLKGVSPPLLLLPVALPVTAPRPEPEPRPEPVPVVGTAPATSPAPAAEPPSPVAPTPAPPTVEPPEPVTAAPPAVPDRPWSPRPLLLAVWLAGSLGWWGLAAWRLRRFGRLLRHAEPAP